MTETTPSPVPLRRVRAREVMPFVIEEGGPTYVVYPTDGETGLLIHKLLGIGDDVQKGRTVDRDSLTDGEERELYQRLLGDALEEMLADGVDWSDIQFVAQVCMAWVVAGIKTAEELRDSGGDPKAVLEARKTQGNRASRRASGASATTTRRWATGTGTRASKTSTSRKSRAKTS